MDHMLDYTPNDQPLSQGDRMLKISFVAWRLIRL
jgi:hypothetical protein